MKKTFKSLIFSFLLIAVAAISLSCGNNDNIVDELVEEGNFKTLVQSLQATGLDQTLRDDGPFTVFAPTDSAFQALGQETLNELINDTAKLSEVLKLHVVSGEFSSDELIDIAQTDGFLISLEGSQLNLSYDGTNLYVNSVQIIDDINADNGIIHIVNKVIN
ncbi:MAG: fasciclin domain-containing protein [Deltaproteobacteria bacterium]|nr:fasciclin domain-containing protein [Deltaproteobacteria bacterium]